MTTASPMSSLFALKIPFRNLTHQEKGRISQMTAKNFPTISAEKYIPLVNATNCTTILETPGADLSDVMQPMSIPKAMNNRDAGIDDKMQKRMFMVSGSPSKTAVTKNTKFWIITMGKIARV